MQSFADFVTKERERLNSERENIFTQQQELETKLTDINRELAAIDAYEAAKSGKAPATSRTRAARTSTGRRSGIRDDVLAAVKKAGSATSAQVRTALGIGAGDKSGAQSVSNALSALKTAGKLTLDDSGAYKATS